uniref:hydroxymethylglutaryl-CoA lyase n=1 Tax=Haptolina ericina TaxID=156174 RepID=A0A7S3AL43_9EUKA
MPTGGFYQGLPDVRIYELGPRDGLQNESVIVDAPTKIQLVDLLSATGVAAIETTSFVHPKWVPQMADNVEVLTGISGKVGVDYPVLVPNLKGFEKAIAAGARSVAVIGIPSETFSQKNLNCTVEQGLERTIEVVNASVAAGVPCRGYVSCSLGCPFEGPMEASVVARHAAKLYEAGCYEIAIADTIGCGTPGDMERLLRQLTPSIPASHLAVHCHDTYGQALANILCALQHGVCTVDSSVAGLGGCPFAGPAASGNVATEDVVYMLNGLGVRTGVDFDLVVEAGEFIVQVLGRTSASRAAVASMKRGCA